MFRLCCLKLKCPCSLRSLMTLTGSISEGRMEIAAWIVHMFALRVKCLNVLLVLLMQCFMSTNRTLPGLHTLKAKSSKIFDEKSYRCHHSLSLPNNIMQVIWECAAFHSVFINKKKNKTKINYELRLSGLNNWTDLKYTVNARSIGCRVWSKLNDQSGSVYGITNIEKF